MTGISIDSRVSPSQPPWLGALLAIVVLAVLWPVVTHEFGGLDDDMNVASNPYLNPPTWQTLRHYWTTPQFDLYVPFTYTVWSVAARLAWSQEPDPTGLRLNPHIFHFTNLALHILAAIAVFEVLQRAVAQTWAAWLGALVFALHPLQVESVAWVAGMKDVLAGMLALVALWLYLSRDEPRVRWKSRCRFALATVAFVLAMLSKPSAVVLPVIAVVLDHLIMHRPLRESAVRALPWLALAIPFIIVARLAQPAPFIGQAIPLWVRPFIAADALAFYLSKLAFPAALAVDYSRTPQSVIASGVTWFTWSFPALIVIAAYFARRRAPLLTAAFLIFVIALLPVLGLIPFDFQAYSTVADHYLYLAMLGPALGMAWLASRCPRRVFLSIGVALVVVLSLFARQQTKHWRDAFAIFSHTVDVNPHSWLAHNQLAVALGARGNFEQAVAHARTAVELNPHALPPRFVLGANLAQLGKIDDAIEAYLAFLDIKADDVPVNTNVANLLAERGRFDDAIRHYQIALQNDPGSSLAHANLAGVYEELDRLNEAIYHYQIALEVNPNFEQARMGLSRATQKQGLAAPASQP